MFQTTFQEVMAQPVGAQYPFARVDTVRENDLIQTKIVQIQPRNTPTEEQRRRFNEAELIVPSRFLGLEDLDLERQSTPEALAVISQDAARAILYTERVQTCAKILGERKALKTPLMHAAVALMALFIAIIAQSVGNPQSIAQVAIVYGAFTVATATGVTAIAGLILKAIQPDESTSTDDLVIRV